MSKRVLAVAVVLIMLTSFASCGPSDTTTAGGGGTTTTAATTTGATTTAGTTAEGDKPFKGVELTLWLEMTFSEPYNEAIEAEFQKWASINEAKVNIEWISQQDNLKITAAVEAGSGIPDIMFVSSAARRYLNFYPNYPQSVVTELMDKINADKPYLDNVVKGSKFEGQNYFIPVLTSCVVTFARMDKLAEAGITEPPTTWDKVFEAAEAISDPDNDFYGLSQGFGPNDGDDQNAILYSIWSSGGRVWNNDGEVDMDSIARDTVLRYARYFEEGVIPDDGATWDDGGNNGNYLMGRTGFCFNAATLYGAMTGDAAYADLLANTAVYGMPHGGIEGVASNNLVGFYVMSACKNTDAAYDIIDYILDPAVYDPLLEMVSPIFGPVFKRFENDPVWNDGSVYQAVLSYAQNSAGYMSYPSDSVIAQTTAAKSINAFQFISMISSVIGGTDVDTAIAKFKADCASLG